MRIALMGIFALTGGVATHLHAQDSTAGAAPAAGPPPAAAAPTAATAPAPATKTGLAAALGLYVFPAKGQTPEQQSQDEQACYTWSKEQSGIDPATVKANPDSAMKAASAKVDTAAQGAAVRGAARGAAGGAVVGAIAGDAGTGAGVGAVVGAVGGRRAKKQAKKQAEQQASQQANAWAAGQIDTFKKGMTACLEGKGYTVK
jgi:hypothetical protein